MEARKYTYLPHYKYEDYLAWEGNWELIEGIAYAMSPMPSMYHQDLNGNIFAAMKDAMTSCGKCKVFMPIDWMIAEDTVVQPDVLIICEPYEMGTYLSKTPTIIFEILSPSTAEKDRNLKYALYEKEGVKYYIIVNPLKKSAEIFLLQDGKYTLVTEIDNGSFAFEVEDCEVPLDFGKIW